MTTFFVKLSISFSSNWIYHFRDEQSGLFTIFFTFPIFDKRTLLCSRSGGYQSPSFAVFS